MELESVYKVIHLIENQYNKEIPITEIERVACYSYRNIQRIFKYTCGETIGAYQKRLKLENGYKALLYTQESISNIALDAGFEGVASFSKSFKKLFGISPKLARSEKLQLFQKNGITPKTLQTNLTSELLYIPETKIYYISKKTHYLNEEIDTLWEKLLSYDVPAAGAQYYGIIIDEPLITIKINCRYDACINLPDKNHQLQSKNIFGGRYAKFIHYGFYDNIEETYAKIYAGWILNAKWQFDSSPIIEHYKKHPDNTKSQDEYITEIFIPIKK